MATKRKIEGACYPVERKSGPAYYAKWRTPEGQQVKRLLGEAWLRKTDAGWKRRGGRVPEGFLTENQAAIAMRKTIDAHEAQRLLEEAAGGRLTFGDLAERWYADSKNRGLKASTLRDYEQAVSAHLLPPHPDDPNRPDRRLEDADRRQLPAREKSIGRAPFAGSAVSELAPSDLRRWYGKLPHGRTKEKIGMILNAVLKFGISEGLIADDPKLRVQLDPVNYSDDYEFHDRDELDQVLDAAASEQDAAIFLTAAFTGLRRGELIALQWRSVRFEQSTIRVRANYSTGVLDTPKSGKVRTVPMVGAVADRLTALMESSDHTAPTDPVFPGAEGKYLDGSALTKRFAKATKRAGVRHFPLHSLRHYFGSYAATKGSIVQVQSWMGHSDLKTTARYLHAVSKATDAALLAEAFS